MNELVPAKLIELQEAMLRLPQATVFETSHYWADGMYCRRVWRPRGSLIVGKVHKKEHLLLCTLGKVVVTNGLDKFVILAGEVRVCVPGTKRATLALEDSVLVTVHRAEMTDDLETLENELTQYEPSPFGPGNVLRQELLS